MIEKVDGRTAGGISSVCVAREERSWGGGTNSVETGDASQDFEEFVVAKVEQPA